MNQDEAEIKTQPFLEFTSTKRMRKVKPRRTETNSNSGAASIGETGPNDRKTAQPPLKGATTLTVCGLIVHTP